MKKYRVVSKKIFDDRGIEDTSEREYQVQVFDDIYNGWISSGGYRYLSEAKAYLEHLKNPDIVYEDEF